MARNTTDYGTQTITIDFQQTGTSQEINALMHKIIRPGIYNGFTLSIESTSEFRLSTGVLFIQASNDVEVSVRVATSADITQSIASATPYVIGRYEWHDDPSSYMNVLTVAEGDIETTDVVFGKGTFSGGDLTGFDNTDRDYISWDADTTELGDTATITSAPTGGDETNLIGTTDVVAAIQEAFDRLIDLSGVNDDAVKNRHVDFGTGANQINGGDLNVSNEITMGGSASNIISTATLDTALQSLATALKNMTGADDDSVTNSLIDLGNGSDGVNGTNINIGGDLTPGNSQSTITATVKIKTALQQILNLIKDLSGVDDEAVKARHVDFGVADTQINGGDIHLGTAISQTISRSSSISFANSKLITPALTDIASLLGELATRIADNEDNISSNDNDISDFNTTISEYDLLPINTILMYNGTNWTDSDKPNFTNGTLPGWVACTSTNSNFYTGYNVPNLQDKFIMGSTEARATGGNSSITITENNLPVHTHTIPAHDHTGTADSQNAAHTHGMAHTHSLSFIKQAGLGSNGVPHTSTDPSTRASQTNTSSKSVTDSGNAAHTHDLTINSKDSFDTGNGGFANNSISILPPYHTVIFIIKLE